MITLKSMKLDIIQDKHDSKYVNIQPALNNGYKNHLSIH